LDFVLDDSISKIINDAEKSVDDMLNTLDTHVALNDAVNSNWVKAHKIGPDGFLQMAFQLAHASMYNGKSGVTYESASTSAFKHGRTETIRSTTNLSQHMCDVFLNENSTNEEKANALRAAADNHGKLTRDALMGKGWDRHLFALKDLALKNDMDLPSIFTCEAYQQMATIILSTSTLQSDALDGGGFGPVNPDCYAIPYGITKDNCRFGVMSYGRNSKEFCQAIENSVEVFKQVLETEKIDKKEQEEKVVN
jgi:carnitine O-palmitoyltransferase 2